MFVTASARPAAPTPIPPAPVREIPSPTDSQIPADSHEEPTVSKRPLEPTLLKPPSRRRRNNKTPRKCHDCKSSVLDFRRCNYWFLTGSRCGKTYCFRCLKVTYGMNCDNTPATDKEWHCPSCLGTCICPDCVKERRKEQRRQEHANNRRSSRSNQTV